ncbi:MAG: hypothetical protein ACI379_06270 [Nocardioides sp.]|uniref:hypothetical protein n=1 Tax=Nocardioides sp. TaxID=35761 RepID=UPI003F0A48FE
MGDEEVERADVEALLAARRELGSEYEKELVESFAARVEEAVAGRTKAVADRDRSDLRDAGAGQIRQFVLGVVSLGVGVPITIVPMVAADGALPAVGIAWLGIAAVNAAHASAVNGRARRR